MSFGNIFFQLVACLFRLLKVHLFLWTIVFSIPSLPLSLERSSMFVWKLGERKALSVNSQSPRKEVRQTQVLKPPDSSRSKENQLLAATALSWGTKAWFWPCRARNGTPWKNPYAVGRLSALTGSAPSIVVCAVVLSCYSLVSPGRENLWLISGWTSWLSSAHEQCMQNELINQI